MKINRLFPVGFVSAFLFLTGCSKDETQKYRGPEESQIPFSVHATETSSVSTWAVGNRIAVYTVDPSGAGGVNINTPLTIEEGGIVNANTVAFSGSLMINTPTGVNKIYAYYPYAVSAAAASYNAIPFSLSATQTMRANSYDRNYDYMYANGEFSVIPSGNSLKFESQTLEFRHIVGFMNFTITGIDPDSYAAGAIPSDREVTSVTITASGQSANPRLTGDFTLDTSTGTMKFASESGSANKVTAQVASGTMLANLSAWMVVNPFTLSGANEKLEIRIAMGDDMLIKEVSADELASGSQFSVTAGNVTTIRLPIDNTWIVENNDPDRIQSLYLVKNNVGPHTLCFGWEELAGKSRDYIVQLFTDRTGSPVYTSPELSFKTNNTLYTGTPGGYGPVRFTFTELEADTKYYMRVKHKDADDKTYSNFLEGKTEALHIPVAGEVFYQGFDKIYWGSDAMNSSSGTQPGAYDGANTKNPAGWANLTKVLQSDANPGVNMTSLNATTNKNDDYGLTGWRYTNTVIYTAPGYIKLGSGSVNGSLRTPAMGSTLPAAGADCILTFRAFPFVISGAGSLQVFIVHSEANETATSTAEPTDITNILTYNANKSLNPNDTATTLFIGNDDRTANYQWTERTLEIPGLKPTDKIWFKSSGTTYRYLLDEIHVVKKK